MLDNFTVKSSYFMCGLTMVGFVISIINSNFQLAIISVFAWIVNARTIYNHKKEIKNKGEM